MMVCPGADIALEQLGRTLALFVGSGGWSEAHAKIGFAPGVEDWVNDKTKGMSDANSCRWDVDSKDPLTNARQCVLQRGVQHIRSGPGNFT